MLPQKTIRYNIKASIHIAKGKVFLYNLFGIDCTIRGTHGSTLKNMIKEDIVMDYSTTYTAPTYTEPAPEAPKKTLLRLFLLYVVS